MKSYGEEAMTLFEATTIVYVVLASALVIGGSISSPIPTGLLTAFAVVICSVVAAVAYAVAHLTRPPDP